MSTVNNNKINNNSIMLTIDIPDNDEFDSQKSVKRQQIEHNLSVISATSNTLPEKKTTVEKIIGQSLGKGKFGVISVYTPDATKIIKESYSFDHIHDCLNTTDDHMLDSIEHLISDVANEPDNVKHFSSLYEQFPKNILRLHDYFTCKNNNYYQHNYVMDRVTGCTLNDYIKYVTINTSDQCAILVQVLYIILYANLSGLYHNDITSKNTMIDHDKSDLTLDCLILGKNKITVEFKNIHIIKIIDYGLCRNTHKVQMFPIELYQVVNMFNNLFPENDMMLNNIFQYIYSYADELIDLNKTTWGPTCTNVSSNDFYENIKSLNDIDVINLIELLTNLCKLNNNIEIKIEKL